MRIVLVFLMLLLTACGGSKAIAPVGNQGYATKTPQVKYASSKPPTIYKVRKGDTLYSISWRYGMDYKTLAKYNNIRSPYRLAIGQKLRFKPIKIASKSKPKPTSTKPAASTSKPAKPKPSIKPAANTKLTWQWPTRGKVISTYSKTATGRKGINIAGKAGQTIVAAASGKVVYAGNGLPRYGNLLIVKHNDVYLSAYAHNTKLLVKEGDYVKAGQKIARLGSTGTQRNQLHFEVRRNGKPVDPIRFLPKR
ncbi:MAG: peptidoglycan DD-metalloendopeptidase family protein [Methylophaga sp.]|nr:peptidoglycan DD-metalloendopeptidase family protein [Methylophaga sp.]